ASATWSGAPRRVCASIACMSRSSPSGLSGFVPIGCCWWCGAESWSASSWARTSVMSDVIAPSTVARTSAGGRVVAGLVYCYPILLLMLVWELLAHSGLISPLLWPSLEKIAVELWRFAVRGDLVFHGSITLQRALSGFLLAVVVGILL